MYRITFKILAFIMLISCTAKEREASYTYQTPTRIGDGWEVSSLTDQGIDPAPITKMIKKIKHNHYTGISSVVIAHEGVLVLDEYFGEGEQDAMHSMRSASKTITSALIGIAIDQKFIATVNAPLLPYFPEYQGKISNWDERKNNITLAHILSMTSGIQGNENEMYPTNDWIKFYLDQPLVNTPGEVFSYATSGVVTLGDVISRTSGLGIPAFTNRFLFNPLGITEYFWPITNSKGSQGLAMTGGGVKLKSRDMAKFGQLYLNKGVWKGNQVISELWINSSTKKHSTSDLYGEDFGYIWRMISRTILGRKIHSFEAWGNGGQFIIVFPSLELVTVFTGENYGLFPEMEQPFEMIDQFILPAVIKTIKSTANKTALPMPDK